MKTHLSPQEFVDVLDGALSTARLAHLDACDECRAEARTLGSLMSGVQATPIPEPSPFFWDHFSRRVHLATRAEAMPRYSWWRDAWRPLIALTAVAALALVLVLRVNTPRPLLDTTAATDASSLVPLDGGAGRGDESFNLIASVAATALVEEVRQTARPTSDATDAMLDQLTAQQRTELVRLLMTKIGGAE